MPAVDATVITPPRPRSSIPGRNAWVSVTSASQFSRTSSASRFASVCAKRPCVPKPALLTSTSTCTPSSATFCASDSASLARSHAITCALPRSCEASSCMRSARRATRITS